MSYQASIFSDIHASLDQLRTALRRLVRKKTRNQKTRQQYKKKAQAQRVTIQEVEHSDGQEVEHSGIRISVEKASKHEAFVKSTKSAMSVTWNGISTVATSSHWHAVISYVGMTLFDGMIMIGTIGTRRMGVG